MPDLPFEQADYPYAQQPPNGVRLPKPQGPDSPRGDVWLPLIVVVVAGLIADFATVPLTDVFNERDFGALIVFAGFGMALAQGGIVSAALVWLSGPFWLRFVLHWFAVGVGTVVWLFGLWVIDELDIGNSNDEIVTVLCVLPVVGLAIQLPLWVMRQYLGWRLVRCDFNADEANSTRESLSIRDLFGATLIVALSLALMRVAQHEEPEVLFAMAVTLPIVMAVSAISVLPAGGLLLGWRNWRAGLAIIFTEALLASVIILTITEIFRSFGGGMRSWEWICLTTVLLSFAGMLAAAALAARAAGFRMQMGKGAPLPDGGVRNVASPEEVAP